MRASPSPTKCDNLLFAGSCSHDALVHSATRRALAENITGNNYRCCCCPPVNWTRRELRGL